MRLGRHKHDGSVVFLLTALQRTFIVLCICVGITHIAFVLESSWAHSDTYGRLELVLGKRRLYHLLANWEFLLFDPVVTMSVGFVCGLIVWLYVFGFFAGLKLILFERNMNIAFCIGSAIVTFACLVTFIVFSFSRGQTEARIVCQVHLVFTTFYNAPDTSQHGHHVSHHSGHEQDPQIRHLMQLHDEDDDEDESEEEHDDDKDEFRVHVQPKPDSLTRQWNELQRQFECCGVYSSEDFNNLVHPLEGLGEAMLPSSCCTNRRVCRNDSDAVQEPCRDAILRLSQVGHGQFLIYLIVAFLVHLIMTLLSASLNDLVKLEGDQLINVTQTPLVKL